MCNYTYQLNWLSSLVGFPPQCYDIANNRAKTVSLSVLLNEGQLTATIHEFCPKLGKQSFRLYQMSKQRQLLPIEAKTAQELRDLKYQGVTIICSEGNIPPNITATYQEFPLLEGAVTTSPTPPTFIDNLLIMLYHRSFISQALILHQLKFSLKIGMYLVSHRGWTPDLRCLSLLKVVAKTLLQPSPSFLYHFHSHQ